jgi:HSP20 family molecular chaperone IbpA
MFSAHNFDLSKTSKRNIKINVSIQTNFSKTVQLIMNFSKSTVIALAAMPSVVSSWSMGPSYCSTPRLRLVETTSPVEVVLRKQRMVAQRMLEKQVTFSSNRYELVDNTEKFQLTVDVPGIKEEDIDIKLDDGQLTIKGERVASSDSSRFTSKFSQSFYLDPTVDVDNFTATLKNGVLVVSAPKDMGKLEDNVRRIPITSLEDILAEADKKEEDVPIIKDEGDEEETEIPVDSSPAASSDDANEEK